MDKKKDGKYNFIWVATDSHKPPVFKEVKSKDWIIYGDKNIYPDYLIDLYNTSPKHNAIINGKVGYIVGQGFTCSGTMPLATKARIEGFIKSVGEDSLTELTYKLATDIELFGGYVVEPILSKGGDKIAGLSHIDFSKIRVSVDGDRFFYTSDWKSRKPQDNEDFKEFSPFDPEDIKADTLIYYKTYRPDLKEYPLPGYIGAVPYIEAESEIANYTLSNIKSGFAASFIINFHNGQPTEEEQEYIEQQIKKKFTGSDNAGSFMITFDDGKEKAVDVIPINDDGKQDKFLNLITQTGQEIFTGHNIVSPQLFGVVTSTGFSDSADQLRTASEAFQNRYVTPKQKILEDLYNAVLVFNGLPSCLEIIRTEVVTESFSEATITQVMTTAEIRKSLGLPVDEVQVNQVAEALGTISPLVATKVLDNMTANEIRAIVGLGTSNVVKPKPPARRFSKEEEFNALDGLDEIGYKDEELEFISHKFTQFNPFENEVDTLADEALFKRHAFATALEVAILDILKANPTATVEDIALDTGESPEIIEEQLQKLEAKNLISRDGDSITVEDEGDEVDEEVFIVYKYVKRPDVSGGAIIDGTRDFCKDLVRKSEGRSWTRDQIRLLNNGMGLDVFRSRGGFYNKNGVITPYCRHIWEQRLVRRR